MFDVLLPPNKLLSPLAAAASGCGLLKRPPALFSAGAAGWLKRPLLLLLSAAGLLASPPNKQPSTGFVPAATPNPVVYATLLLLFDWLACLSPKPIDPGLPNSPKVVKF